MKKTTNFFLWLFVNMKKTTYFCNVINKKKYQRQKKKQSYDYKGFY